MTADRLRVRTGRGLSRSRMTPGLEEARLGPRIPWSGPISGLQYSVVTGRSVWGGSDGWPESSSRTGCSSSRTLLLVCVSVVMVYSASAAWRSTVTVRLTCSSRKQALWAVLGLGVLAVSMRIDYRTYRNEAFIWALLGAVGVLLVAVLFSRADQRRAPLVRRRRPRHPAVRAREDRRRSCSRR